MKAPQKQDNELIHQDSLSPCLCVADLFVQNRLDAVTGAHRAAV